MGLRSAIAARAPHLGRGQIRLPGRNRANRGGLQHLLRPPGALELQVPRMAQSAVRDGLQVRLPALLRSQRNRARRRMVDTPLRGGRAHAQGTAPSLQQRAHVLGHRGLASVDGADVRPPAESVQVAHLHVPLERGFRAMGRDQPRRPGDRAPGAGRDRLRQQARDDLSRRSAAAFPTSTSVTSTNYSTSASSRNFIVSRATPALHQRMQVTTAKPCALASA